MKSLALVLLLCIFAGAQLPAAVQTKVFSAPSAGSGSQQGTFPAGINSSGLVVGSYYDASDLPHGFLFNNTTGRLVQFDAFGASADYTQATGINDGGTIVGYFQTKIFNPQGLVFGFVRAAQGAYTRFGASSGQSVQTNPAAINASGVIAGTWSDSTSANPFPQCFVRDASGNITTFAAPNQGVGCSAMAINSSDEVVGSFQDEVPVVHGFLRDAGGNITVIDPPGSTHTTATAINSAGQVAGYFTTTVEGQRIEEGFIYNTDATYTTFRVSIASGLTYQIGQVVALNDAGEAAGTAEFSGGAVEGWTRSPQGKITTFQVCGQTGVTALNNAGHLVGFCGAAGQMLNYDGFTF